MARVLPAFLALLVLAACSSGPAPRASGESAAEINARLGLSYMRQGNREVALAKLKKALDQDPNLASAHHYIAELYRQLGSHELAERHYRRAMELAPADPDVRNNYGVFLCGRGRYGEAEERFLAAAAMPDNRHADEAYENAALCALRIPDAARAEQHFRRALDINPVRPNALYQMALLSYDAGHYLQGRAFLQRFEAAARHTAQSLSLGARIETKLGGQEGAARYGRLLEQQFPDAPETAQWREERGR